MTSRVLFSSLLNENVESTSTCIVVDFEQADKDRRSLTCSQSHSQRQEIPAKKWQRRMGGRALPRESPWFSGLTFSEACCVT